jgi:hypothetical protein
MRLTKQDDYTELSRHSELWKAIVLVPPTQISKSTMNCGDATDENVIMYRFSPLAKLTLPTKKFFGILEM